ncbi:Protein kinase [Quillaja saponaria]|uniref:mitogen-activated protein kinase kinase kinase n=1 Tax=Quillaja saponaria TaxID=32244 RepID=A0AAD7P757_QUISA|nr:Protein kinase [Quillaja saponaria]
MHWLPTISFSPSTSLKSSPSSSTAVDIDYSKKKPSNATRGGGGGWRFVNGKRLTRERKLRHLTDHDVKSLPRLQNSATDDDVVMPLSCSPSICDRYSARSCLASSPPVVPQPLPLPELPFRMKDGDFPLPSPKDRPRPSSFSRGSEERDRSEGAFDGISSSVPIRSVFSSQERGRHTENVKTKSSRRVHQDLSGFESSQHTFSTSVPTMSAPTSPFSSPTVSPQRTSAGDFLPYYYMTPKISQVWSAPEMPVSETMSGQPPHAFFDITAFSTDSSPLHSPQGRSPHRNPRNPSGPSSPIHPKISLDTPTARRENNAPVSVHPLPLPPGAALPSPSPSTSQVTSKLEGLSMKRQWQKGKLIGCGTFGSVYVATNRETGALCAMKEVELFPDDPKSTECIKQLEQEIKVLSHLKHPNIVQYFGSEIVEDRFYIYLEYVHPGSINKYVREHFGAMNESVVRSFTRHILSGLAYLHSKKTIHRDIKGANLLVDSAGVVKLADFGMAKHLTGQVADLSLKGSPYWMAPELMQAVMQKDNSSDLAFALDIWSLGCTIIEMLTGKPPWSEYEGAAAMFKVMRDTPPIPETLSSAGKDFLKCCFKRNPAERPPAQKLLEHRFLKNSQQLDVPSSTQSLNGITLMDKLHSPRDRYENRPDQLPIRGSQFMKGKVASENYACLPVPSSCILNSSSPVRLGNNPLMKLPT